MLTKPEAQKKINEFVNELRKLVDQAIKKIEEIADEHGIVVEFTGLPPFDEYGNSGYYFPIHSDGTPWLEQDRRNEYYPIEGYGNLEGWLSSDIGC